jgi:hypothetical protein
MTEIYVLCYISTELDVGSCLLRDLDVTTFARLSEYISAQRNSDYLAAVIGEKRLVAAFASLAGCHACLFHILPMYTFFLSLHFAFYLYLEAAPSGFHQHFSMRASV